MDDGTLEQTGRGWQLRFERHLPHEPEKVWRALTEADHLAAWFPTTIEGDRRTGAPLRFAFPQEDSPPLEGEMLAYDPPSLLEFRWDTDLVRFELHPVAGGCRLTFTTVIDEVGKGARDAAGWHVCLDELAHHLEGTTAPEEDPPRWVQLQAHYAELLPDQASTIGPPDWAHAET